MKRQLLNIGLALIVTTSVGLAQMTFQAFLTGLGENPPNASPATGFGTVVLNAAQTQITVDLSWSGLLAPATASHIHGPGGTGTNAPVLFPFTGVPAATAGAIPEQVFSITAPQVTMLFQGYLYMNVHTSVFPGGEIRGQLLLVGPPAYTLTLSTNGPGSITNYPAGSIFPSNTVVTLTAIPATNYTLAGWSGNASGTANPLSVTMTDNKAITANFIFASNAVPAAINLAAQISWYAQTNLHYQVQAASTLNSNVWSDLGGPIAGNNATNSYYDPIGGDQKRFYRVMLRP